MPRGVLLLAAMALLQGASARGEVVTLEEALQEQAARAVDFAVPESPAFAALGLAPEDVIRPSNPRAFAAALLANLDKQGHFQAGLALDTAPYALLQGNEFDIAAYREDPDSFSMRRFLARSQLSVATTQGTNEDDESLRLGLGLRLTPWTLSDSRMDDRLFDCLLGVGSGEPIEGVTSIPAARQGESRQEHRARVREAAEEWASTRTATCLAASERRLSGGSGWELGAAPTWIQENGSGSTTSFGGGTLWTSLALRPWDFLDDEQQGRRDPARSLQYILHARLRIDEQLARSEAGTGFTEQDSLLAGLRLRVSHPISFSLEASYLFENPRRRGHESSLRAALNADIPVANQIWLKLALGGSLGRSEDRIFIGGTLKWGGESVEVAQVVSAIGKLAARRVP